MEDYDRGESGHRRGRYYRDDERYEEGDDRREGDGLGPDDYRDDRDGDDGQGFGETGDYPAYDGDIDRQDRRSGGRWASSCSGFVCPAPLRLRTGPHELRCDPHRGCTTDLCCRELPTCEGFTCTPPRTLCLQPETVMCDASGCVEEKCCVAVASSAAPAYGCTVGDAVTAIRQGDYMQHRASIASLSPDGMVTVAWMDGDNMYPEVPASQVFKNGIACSAAGGVAGVGTGIAGIGTGIAGVGTGMAGAAGVGVGSGGNVQITSDGTQMRPHCSWEKACRWDRSTKETCARKLCQAAGFSGGTYVGASNNMCVASYTNRPFSYYSVDTGQYAATSTGDGNEAQITASCVQQQVMQNQVQPVVTSGAAPFVNSPMDGGFTGGPFGNGFGMGA